RSCHRRRAHGCDRQRTSLDGQGHRDGLRRFRSACRLPCRRARRVFRGCCGVDHHWCCRRAGRGKGVRPGQFRRRDHRYALRDRWIGPQRARKGELMGLDLRVYALVDPMVAGGHTLADLATRIVNSATLVQLRDKKGSTRAMIDEARALHAVLAPKGIPLLVNDRVDVALAAETDGVHIGQDDMAPADARLLLGRTAIIGLSIKTIEQAKAAPLDQLNYVAIGGVYGTTSKDNTAAPIGVGGLRTIVQAIRARERDYPICAIAGINADNAADVIAAGADGIAVISAISLASDPGAAARNLRAVVDGALARRGNA